MMNAFVGTGPYVLGFDLTTHEQLFQEKLLVDSIVHGFEASKSIRWGLLHLTEEFARCQGDAKKHWRRDGHVDEISLFLRTSDRRIDWGQ